MSDREHALASLAKEFANPVRMLVTEIERMLGRLVLVPHLDPTDASALGSNIHSALPNAVAASGLAASGWSVKTVRQGPGNKLICTANIGGKSYDVCLEVHLAGPRGGVGKDAHQFVAAAAGMTGLFPGFEIEAPASFLLFLGLYVDATCTTVEKAYLMYADKIDKRCIAIDLPPATDTGSTGAEPAPPMESPVPAASKKIPGSKVKVKKTAQENRDVGSKDKRGDGSAGA